jgi:tRNA-modifying protein YgfZ
MDLLVADRSERGKLRFTGPQRAWFLHQIMTNHFDPLEPGEAREAALLTPHGRMVGYLEAVATDGAILTHFERPLLETFPDEIRRYVFATQVEIADVTGEMGLVLLAGTGWREAVPGAPAQATRGLGIESGYVWVDRAEVGDVVARLVSEGARETTEDELERIRISNGAVRWGYDMDAKTMPQEARLEGIALHLNKGCYVGQEAVAKIHFRGKVNRKLRHIRAAAPLAAGSDVMADDAKVGTITSSAGGDAIAMLKYTIEPGSVVRAGDVEAQVVA